jgi:hypothetical protein
LRDDGDITASGAQEGIAEWHIHWTTKCVLVEARTRSGVIGIDKDPVAAPLVREELKGS